MVFLHIQEVPQLPASRRMTELAQRLGLNLADALPGHLEVFAHLFQGVRLTIQQPEAEGKHLLFPLGQGTHLFAAAPVWPC